MTAQDHNKIIGSLFAIFGGVNLLLLIPITLQISTVLKEWYKLRETVGDAARPENFDVYLNTLIIISILVIGSLIFSATVEIIAGYAMLKQKQWARVAGALASIASLISIPIGTALGAYALWFLFGEKGRQLYGQSLTATPPQPPKF